MSLLTLAAILSLSAAPSATAIEAPLNDLQLTVLGKFGASAALIGVVPSIGAAPGVGFGLRYRHKLSPTWRLTLGGAATLGGADDGSGIIGTLGSYQLTLGFDYQWFDLSWVALTTKLHAGFQSIAYFPIPTWGAENAITFRPVDFEHFQWTINGTVDTEFFIVAPSISVGLLTGAYTDFFGYHFGIELGGSAQGIVAFVANSVAANAYARLVFGFAF